MIDAFERGMVQAQIDKYEHHLKVMQQEINMSHFAHQNIEATNAYIRGYLDALLNNVYIEENENA